MTNDKFAMTNSDARMKLRTLTLGCKVNQYETEYVREGLLGIGYEDAIHDEHAELCLVNTCTVTAEGDSKSRQAIRRMARRNPGAKIVVMGCYATRAPEEVAKLPGVSQVVTDKRELPDLLGRFGVTDIPTGISGFGRRHRAYVKVQDGCMLRCSFCIIPYVRPNLASRPVQHILDEIRRLVDGGYREVVLTGIHLGHYGVDWNRQSLLPLPPGDGRGEGESPNRDAPSPCPLPEGEGFKPKDRWIRLSHLVRQIAELPGDFRVRLSSIEATEVTRELIDVMVDHPEKVAPHLHISMQSGSDSVLRRMRRRWGRQRFIDRCRLLQERLDRPAITTDIIVGFPGETETEFAETIETARAVGFSKIHIFPFSPRRGTPAAEMPNQVPKQVQQGRTRELAAVEAELRDRYYRSLIGRKLRVLVEAEERGGSVGTSCRYATVESSLSARVGDFMDVVADDVCGDRIIGPMA
jgi:threonylcarbamoyladenosine tRNA methylthiotransferase MtaB